MNRLSKVVILVAIATAVLGPASASAEYGFEKFDATFTEEDGFPVTQAGSHPFAVTTSVVLNSTEVEPSEWVPDGELKDLIVEAIPGFTGNATAMPRCATVDFIRPGEASSSCPNNTAVGLSAPRLTSPDHWLQMPVFNLEPPPGVPVRLGFVVLNVPVIVDIGISQRFPYNVEALLGNTSQLLTVFGGAVQLWGDPTDPRHDRFRGVCGEDGVGSTGEVEFIPSAKTCPVEAAKKAFLTLPRSCTGPAVTRYATDSWQNPGAWVTGSVLTHDNAIPPNPIGFDSCEKLGFAPRVEAQLTTDSAETGSGMDFNVSFSDEGLISPDGRAQSDVKKAEVTLPEGVTINPSIGEGLGVCTPADLDRETLRSAPGDGCPNASKIGTLQLATPLVDEGIDGSVFLAQQDDPGTSEPGAENPFDSLIALYLVLKNTNLGVNVKLPLKVEPDPQSGQLVATMDDIPQVPFSSFNFHFREGQRAPLVSPSACGTYTTEAKFSPWSDPDNARTVTSSFRITRGIGGGGCPAGGVPSFRPGFEAGSLNNDAGAFSPFTMRLIRSDGEQDMTKFSSILPPGVLGSLVGVGKCPDAAVDVARAKTGRQELASPSCPASSRIGRTLAGAGVGSALTYVGGQIYLAGPYKGAPLSVIAITPAVAGPFDAGTVAVRLGLDLNPKTAEVEVDGAASDPIPHILQGIVLKLRDLRVYVDRPNFTLNPTSCDESSARATLFGSYLNVQDPADDVPVDLSTRYQAASCLSLGFKPRLTLTLKGGTRRGGNPGLVANYRPRAGHANLKSLVVRLPRSAFLDQSHIRTICTRVQFAGDACPRGARYGYIKAWTPLLEEPLQGPVYLRSSNHKLPDLVFDLHGLVDVEVATRIDSVRGGIRAIVQDAPDAPLSKVVLRMQGGKKGLIVNSRNLCSGRSRAKVRFAGHNGKRHLARPQMKAANCAKKRKRSQAHRRGGKNK